MKASSCAAALVVVVLSIIPSLASAGAMAPRPGLIPPHNVARQPGTVRGDRSLRPTDAARVQHDQSPPAGAWATGGDSLPDLSASDVDAPAPQYFAAPTTDIAATPAAPSLIGQATPIYARASGPKIITIGAPRRSTRFAKMPLVVYGGTPLNQAF